MYAGTINGGVFMSQDTGRTWVTANTGLGSMNIKKIIANNTHIIAAAATGAVYSTLAGAISWSVTTGLSVTTDVSSFATDGAITFLGSITDGVYSTTNNMAWTSYTTGLTNMTVTSLAIKGTNVFAGTLSGGIFKSPVSGAGWATANTGLPTMNIFALHSAGQWVVAGYKGGVHSSFDDGATWLPPNVLLYIPEFADVNNISFSSSSTRIFVGLPNNSLYSNSLTELPLAINEIEYSTENVLIFPNPSNGNFRVNLKDLNAEVSEVVVYDNMGKLLQRYKNANNETSIQISAGYSKGIYFLHLKTDKGTIAKKIVIE